MIGIVATTSDASPLATMVSAQVSITLLTLISSTPTSASFHASLRVTRRLFPRITQNPASKIVDSSVRQAPTSGGGRSLPATRIAVYVDPQKK